MQAYNDNYRIWSGIKSESTRFFGAKMQPRSLEHKTLVSSLSTIFRVGRVLSAGNELSTSAIDNFEISSFHDNCMSVVTL